MHPLLTRQIKRYLGETDRLNLELQCFINAVEQSYRQFEEDAQFNERALELVSIELNERNSRLRQSERPGSDKPDSDALGRVQARLQALQSLLAASPSPTRDEDLATGIRETLAEIEKLGELPHPPSPKVASPD